MIRNYSDLEKALDACFDIPALADNGRVVVLSAKAKIAYDEILKNEQFKKELRSYKGLMRLFGREPK